MKRLAIGLGIVCAFETVLAAVTGATATDPKVAEQQVAASKPPAPTQPVNVMNWPAEQVVSGTVSVGNLPLANDGSVRVSSGPAKRMVIHELLSEPVLVGAYLDLPTIIDTTGYESMAVYVKAEGCVGITARWRWDDDEEFAEVYDQRGWAGFAACKGGENTRIVCPVFGGSVRILLNGYCTDEDKLVTSVRVYLMP